MQCRLCGRALRWDEDMRPVMVDHELAASFFVGAEVGNTFACPDCQAKVRGEPPPEPRRYPVGCRIPRKPGSDGDLPICGLCRVALPYGQERGEPLRLRPEFVTPEDGVEAGGYSACQACVARWKPRILAYLQEIGELPRDLTRLPKYALF